MTHLSGTGDPSHPSNHIVAGPALRFVHYYQSRKHASQYIRAATAPDAGPPARRRVPARRTLALALTLTLTLTRLG